MDHNTVKAVCFGVNCNLLLIGLFMLIAMKSMIALLPIALSVINIVTLLPLNFGAKNDSNN